MTVADFIADFLSKKGVTDVFGIPGGVVLELIYAFDRTEGITPHLSYHEQCAAFEASGYAQANAAPGVAFATRGPGIMNMVTSIADAYCDSNAIIVFTSHASDKNMGKIRVIDNQEFNLEPIFASITKAFIRIDTVSLAEFEIYKAFDIATSGRKGPVVVDINSKILTQDIALKGYWGSNVSYMYDVPDNAVYRIKDALCKSVRPVLLIGDGIKQSSTTEDLRIFCENNKIPVISSRYCEDTIPDSEMYFGYIGTHAARSANFILSKADLIIGLGNRMAFPVNSKSYRPLVEKTRIIRIEVDYNEFEREVPCAENYCVDLKELMPLLRNVMIEYTDAGKWLEICRKLKDTLEDYDVNEPVALLADILKRINHEFTITSDVGNNEMWLSRAYIKANNGNRLLYSKTFGALGCSIAKAIGAYYATRKPVICFLGDQGMQLNIQELQMISYNKLPIIIVLLNNLSSGMIREHEEIRHGKDYLLTTEESGYALINAPKIADAYGLKYYEFEKLSVHDKDHIFQNVPQFPMLIEIKCSIDNNVAPTLKKGDPCQKLFPYIDDELYSELDSL